MCVRHHALISLGYFRHFSLYPHLFPQLSLRKSRERNREIFIYLSDLWMFFCFFCFCFFRLGPVHTPRPPPGGEGGWPKSRFLPSIGTQIPELGP